MSSKRSHLALPLVLVLVAPAHAQLGTPPVPPKLVNQNGATDTTLDSGVTLASRASTGTLMAAFSSNDPALGGGGGDNDIYFTISRDKGATWAPPVATPQFLLATGNEIDIEPSIASKPGSYMLVWASTCASPNGTYDIFSVQGNFDGSAWVNPFAVGFNAGTDTVNDRLPFVAASGGTSVVAWQRNHVGGDTDIWFARTTGNGGPGLTGWSAPAPLQSDAAGDDGRDAHVHLGTNGAGVFVAVWTSTDTLGGTSGDDSDIHFARSTDDGITWSAVAVLHATMLNDPLTQDSHPSVAVDNASGTWVATWRAENAFGGDTDILFARSTDGGTTWSAPAPLNTDAATDNPSSGVDEFPSITADQLGRFVCVWERATGGGDRDIAGALSTDFGGTWTAPELLNTNAATDAGQDTLPRLASDGAGVLVSVWNSTDSLGGIIGTDGDLLSTRFMTPSSTGSVTTRFCFGFTEAGNVNPCPCGNVPTPIQGGCRNSANQGGHARVIDTTSVTSSNVRMEGSSMTPGTAMLMFQGTAQVNFGLGVPFGDGLLCVTGTITRLAVGFASGVGQAIVNTAPTNVSAGSVRYYQGWYRDTGAICGGGFFNLTSAAAATWVP